MRAFRPQESVTERKPTIALIIDSESWAFANIAHQLKHHLSEYYAFRIIPSAVIEDAVQILLMTAQCDVTHFFWRGFLFSLDSQQGHAGMRSLGFREHEQYLAGLLPERIITTSVYDHLFLGQAEMEHNKARFHKLVSAYTVCSQRLLDIYRRIDGLPKPLGLTEDGVDLELFRPINLQRFDSLGQRPMVIGWAGNSLWSSERGEDFKGLHTLLKPAVRELQDEGLNLTLLLADRQQRHIPHEHMYRYYAQLDLYVCSSKIEGTPNPVLEASACGVPVITTDVGVVPELFGDDPYKMVLPARDLNSLKAAIRRHYLGGVGRTRAISSYGLHRVESWSWRRKVTNYRYFFDQVLRQRQQSSRIQAYRKLRPVNVPDQNPNLGRSGHV